MREGDGGEHERFIAREEKFLSKLTLLCAPYMLDSLLLPMLEEPSDELSTKTLSTCFSLPCPSGVEGETHADAYYRREKLKMLSVAVGSTSTEKQIKKAWHVLLFFVKTFRLSIYMLIPSEDYYFLSVRRFGSTERAKIFMGNCNVRRI